jgi:hypothetical protein
MHELDYITLSLTTKRHGRHIVPSVSGLNWGQRYSRNPNQAYISIPKHVQESVFFPERGVRFLVKCDDDFEFWGVRAQEHGKGLHSLPQNSILGEYFRTRLGLPSGSFVTITHLLDYGRTTVDIYRRTDGSYYLDFAQH